MCAAVGVSRVSSIINTPPLTLHSHNNPYSRRYICSSCVLTFDTRPALETHQHLCHPSLTTSNSATSPIPPMQDVAHDLSIRSETNPSPSQASSPLVCPVDGCGVMVGCGSSLAEHIRDSHGGSGGSSCPHCGYQLTHDELSRDHWLTHHSEVCAACVHVFTAVYGPQLWKKVHVRPTSLESPLDAIVTGLNRKRTANDGQPGEPMDASLSVLTSLSMHHRDSPSPGSDTQDTDNERFSKRSRKQRCPKKVITVAEEGENSAAAGASRKHNSVRGRRRAMLNRPGFVSRQCHRCPRRPIFASRARLQLHVKWSHGKRSTGRKTQPAESAPPAAATVH